MTSKVTLTLGALSCHLRSPITRGYHIKATLVGSSSLPAISAKTPDRESLSHLYLQLSQ